MGLDASARNSPGDAIGMMHAKPPVLTWTLTDHCCKFCFGRILASDAPDGRKVFRCSCCEAQAEGASEAVLCCCGMKLRTGADAEIRCMVQENPSSDFPARIVARAIKPAK